MAVIGRRGPNPLPSLSPGRGALEIGAGLGLGALVGVAVGAAPTPLYVAGGLVGLIAFVAIAAGSDRGLAAFLAIVTLLPFAVIPVPLGGVRLTFLDATLTLLLVLWLARMLGRREPMRTTPVDGLLVLVIGLAVTSFIFGTGHATQAETTRLFLKLINSLLFFFTVVNLVRDRAHVGTLVRLMIGLAAVAATIGLILYALPAEASIRILGTLRPLGYPSGGEVLRYIASTTTLRATSTSLDPNVFGALLMVAAILGTNELFGAPDGRRRWLLPALGVTLACLLLTFSRGSWVGCAAGVAVLAAARYRRLWSLVAVAAVAASLGLQPLERFVGHFISGLFAQDQAAAMRLGEYKDALRLISEYPLFGVGFGGAPSGDLYLGVSSMYLLIAEEMGLIGLAAFLALLAAILANGARAYRDAPDVATRARLLGLLATLVGLLVAGVFDHHFFDIRFPHVGALFWMIVALIFVAARDVVGRPRGPG